MIENYKVTQHINVGYKITKILHYATPTKHLLLCAGHFNALRVYDGNKVLLIGAMFRIFSNRCSWFCATTLLIGSVAWRQAM